MAWRIHHGGGGGQCLCWKLFPGFPLLTVNIKVRDSVAQLDRAGVLTYPLWVSLCLPPGHQHYHLIQKILGASIAGSLLSFELFLLPFGLPSPEEARKTLPWVWVRLCAPILCSSSRLFPWYLGA